MAKVGGASRRVGFNCPRLKVADTVLPVIIPCSFFPSLVPPFPSPCFRNLLSSFSLDSLLLLDYPLKRALNILVLQRNPRTAGRSLSLRPLFSTSCKRKKQILLFFQRSELNVSKRLCVPSVLFPAPRETDQGESGRETHSSTILYLFFIFFHATQFRLPL